MTISPQTSTLVEAIERHARRMLVHRDDVALLIELSRRSGNGKPLDELSVFAKFAHKTFGIIQRIGRDAEGHDKLSTEFSNGVEKSKLLIGSLLEYADDETRERFSRHFLDLTPPAFQNLLGLFNDLSCFKNYKIDSANSTDSFTPPARLD